MQQEKITLQSNLQSIADKAEALAEEAKALGINLTVLAHDDKNSIIRGDKDHIDQMSAVLCPVILNHSNGYIFESLMKNYLYRSSAFTRGMQDATFRANWERIEQADIKAAKEKEKKAKEAQQKSEAALQKEIDKEVQKHGKSKK